VFWSYRKSLPAKLAKDYRKDRNDTLDVGGTGVSRACLREVEILVGEEDARHSIVKD
jgi:hypothetical protein